MEQENLFKYHLPGHVISGHRALSFQNQFLNIIFQPENLVYEVFYRACVPDTMPIFLNVLSHVCLWSLDQEDNQLYVRVRAI